MPNFPFPRNPLRGPLRDLVRDPLRGVAFVSFISEWETTNIGTSNNDQISLPLDPIGTKNFLVGWGDGNFDTITVFNQAETTHTYSVVGNYIVTITGVLDGWGFNDAGDEEKLLEVSQWGDLLLGNSGGYFFGCTNLTITATDILNTSAITDMTSAFRDCSSLTTVPNMDNWDMSLVENFRNLFENASVFNQPIDNWDMSLATNTASMFMNASAFNQPLNSWDVSLVINAASMFDGAAAFDQPLDNWNVTSLLNASRMFMSATLFDQDIDNWNVSSITDMTGMFHNAVAFNQPLTSWVTSASIDMCSMFRGAAAFNQSINSWNTTLVTDMADMFRDAVLFNQDINSWNVSSVTDMGNMFQGADAFNQSLNSWDVTSVTGMNSMFLGASAFNGNITSWAVTAATNMQSMFQNTPVFNQNISSWVVSTVTNMSSMFQNADAFDQDISSWTVSAVTTMSSMFRNTAIFNQNIGIWTVSAVNTMSFMFDGAVLFNQDISSWDVSSVTTMQSMFQDATAFNQNIDAWTLTALTNLNSTFSGATAFNQPLNSWNVSLVTNMNSTFDGATIFDQDVSAWNVVGLTSAVLMFNASAFQITNYDLLLVAWEPLALQNNVPFSAGSAMFSSGTPATAKADIIANFSWTITDGGELPFEPDQIADLELWLDAADASTITESADFVSQWDDKSGNAFNVTQGTGSAQPMTNQNTLNSLNVITTDGNDTMLVPSGLNFVGAGPNTRFVVSRRASEDASNDNIFTITQGSAARISLQYSSTSGRVSFVHNVSNNLIFSNGNTNTNFQVIMGRRSGTTQALAVDGGTEVTDTNASDVTGITDRDLFALNQITSFLTGDIAEALVYSRSLSSGEITQIIDYFTAKWGVP